MALTITDDYAAQEAAFFDAPGGNVARRRSGLA